MKRGWVGFRAFGGVAVTLLLASIAGCDGAAVVIPPPPAWDVPPQP
jgi:hypothetical protein